MAKIVEEIKKSRDNSNSKGVEENQICNVTWLIFSVNQQICAIEAPVAKEILRNMHIYPLPFVPDFIKGVINRHGEPYTVLDLAVFLGDKAQDASLFVVLNIDDGQFCMQITDVLDFHIAPDSSVIQLSDAKDAPFYEGTIEYKGKNIPVIKIEKIYEKVRTDLGK